MSRVTRPVSPARPDPGGIAAAGAPRASDFATPAIFCITVVALYLARQILIPITLAILLSFVLAPLVDRLRRLRIPRVAAVLAAMVLALSVVLAAGGVIGTQFASLAGNAPAYVETVEQKLTRVRGLTLERLAAFTGILARSGSTRPTARPSPSPSSPVAPPTAPAARSTPTTPTAIAPLVPMDGQPVPVVVQEAPATPLELAERVLMPILSPLATLGLVFIVAIFILLERESLRDRVIRLFGARDLHRTTGAMDDAARRLSRYFITQLAINASFGAAIGAGLLAIGLPSPGLWAILAALMRFVPYIGSYIAAALPLALAAAIDPGWSAVLWTVMLFVVGELIMGQAVEPVLYGHSTGLAPISVVLSAVFWGWLWGPIGLILSTPLTLCLVVLGRHVERLEFLDVLLGDSPALTPVQSFYQRMLAGDPDEAAEQAEIMRRDMSLAAYFDQVAIPGLRLAAIDATRGVMNADQVALVRQTVAELLEQLDTERKVEEEQAATPLAVTLPAVPLPVMVVSGRGPLDDSAGRIVATLLEQNGIAHHFVPFADVTRNNGAALEGVEARIALLIQLEIAGASLPRYLARRLRARLPNLPVVIGLGRAADDAAMVTVAMTGALRMVDTVEEALAACREIAPVPPSAVAGNVIRGSSLQAVA